ncbi:hypothetical protein E2C01_011786 [Portunus trituberculatus]|uniref:Uncharacterized protein n=1 Tax=Portunus trituberculatus TaxID=210409 RepID=A0A5B7DC63_PORTR|nr:hypothetical protein [Portunus trituberculatus]
MSSPRLGLWRGTISDCVLPLEPDSSGWKKERKTFSKEDLTNLDPDKEALEWHLDGTQDDRTELPNLRVVKVGWLAELHREVLRAVQQHGRACSGAAILHLLHHHIKPAEGREVLTLVELSYLSSTPLSCGGTRGAECGRKSEVLCGVSVLDCRMRVYGSGDDGLLTYPIFLHLGEGVAVTNNVMPSIEYQCLSQVEVRPVPESSVRVRHSLAVQQTTLI